jgi:hypothetical protein
MVHHGKGAPSGFRRGLDDAKTIEEPKRWSLRFDYASWYKRGEQGSSSGELIDTVIWSIAIVASQPSSNYKKSVSFSLTSIPKHLIFLVGGNGINSHWPKEP